MERSLSASVQRRVESGFDAEALVRTKALTASEKPEEILQSFGLAYTPDANFPSD